MLDEAKKGVYASYTAILLLPVLEIVGLVIDPFDPDARALIFAKRDLRQQLSYLGGPSLEATTILRDVHGMPGAICRFLGGSASRI